MASPGTRLSRRRLGWLLAALLAAALPAAAQPAPDITLTVFAAGLSFPLGLVNAGDGSGRVFIVQQQGKILVHDGTKVLATPFLDLISLLPQACRDDATKCGEQGLLGLAFHPDYKTNGFFYVNYTDVNGNTVIARYHVSANANVANPASGVLLLGIAQPYANHNGGELQFGPDGYLYIGMGDGGSGGDPQFRGQNKSVLLGKLLRIDVDATGAVPCGQTDPAPYGIPASNPFAGSATACQEIWAYGMRNPWRFSFDRVNGDLFIGDVGQNLYEEIDYQKASSEGGENYGWNRMEGFHCYIPDTACNDGSLTLPIFEYGHGPGCSVSGGYVYRGGLYPQLNGVYLFGDYCSGEIWGATRDAAGVWSKRQIGSSQFISSFGEDEAGEMYVVEHSGTVKKISSSTSYARPSIAALTPFAAVHGDPGFDLAVDGSGFTPATVVRWNGSARTTTYVSRTRVTAAISAADVAAAGSATITVSNPAPGGGVSTGRDFEITNVFLDVPASHVLRRPVEGIAAAGVTTGCGTRIFCPDSAVTRDAMAIFLLRAKNGSSYAPPKPTGTVFADVGAGAFGAAFIEQLASDGVTSGCGSGNYCPTGTITRAAMAKLILKTHDGGTYRPATPPTGIFSDVPVSDPFAIWIEELSRRGITSGCASGKFCPNDVVTRAQMAAFLARAFSIPLPP